MKIGFKKLVLITILIVAVTLFIKPVAVFGEEQVFINEEEAEAKFEDDPDALHTAILTNATVVIPSEDYGTRYAQLWKKVVDMNGKRLTGAQVMVDVPEGVHVKWIWGVWQTDFATGYTSSGWAVFFFHWPSGQSITVTVTVSKAGYQTNTEEVTIYGAECYFKCNYFVNRLPPLVSAPEFSMELPIVMSILSGAYLAVRRRRK